MRTTVTIILAAALGIGSTACKKDKEKTPPPPTTTPTAGSAGSGADMAAGSAGSAAAGSAMAGSAAAGSGADMAAGSAGSAGAAATPTEPEMQKKAGNCPSTVFGAVTKVDVKGKDVVLTITSEDKDAIASIQRRTESLLKEKGDGGAGAGAGHDQKGTHGGGLGICPVFYGEGGTAKSKKDAKGVTITITPKIKPEELKATIDERITKAAKWTSENVKPGPEGNQGGVGGGKGAHGGTHQGAGDSKGKERKDGTGGGAGTGGGGSKGTGGGGDATKTDTMKKGG